MPHREEGIDSCAVGPDARAAAALRIRLAAHDDAAAVRAIYAPAVEATVISFELLIPSVEEMAARIAEHRTEHPWIVAETDRGLVGYAYAGPFSARAAYRWSVQTSVYVDRSQRRRGVGRSLYTALFRLLSAQGYRRAFAGITLPNPASVGLHEAVGFTPVGVYRSAGWKLGAWHDVGWWQRDIQGGDRGVGEPSPPRPLDDLPRGVIAAALRLPG